MNSYDLSKFILHESDKKQILAFMRGEIENFQFGYFSSETELPEILSTTLLVLKTIYNLTPSDSLKEEIELLEAFDPYSYSHNWKDCSTLYYEKQRTTKWIKIS